MTAGTHWWSTIHILCIVKTDWLFPSLFSFIVEGGKEERTRKDEKTRKLVVLYTKEPGQPLCVVKTTNLFSEHNEIPSL